MQCNYLPPNSGLQDPLHRSNSYSNTYDLRHSMYIKIDSSFPLGLQWDNNRYCFFHIMYLGDIEAYLTLFNYFIIFHRIQGLEVIDVQVTGLQTKPSIKDFEMNFIAKNPFFLFQKSFFWVISIMQNNWGRERSLHFRNSKLFLNCESQGTLISCRDVPCPCVECRAPDCSRETELSLLVCSPATLRASMPCSVHSPG